MQFAGISLAVGVADIVDDDIDGIFEGLWGLADVAFFLFIVGVLLIAFARIDRIVESRMSPVNRMIWRRRLGLRAWR
jgi:hypothetical protein